MKANLKIVMVIIVTLFMILAVSINSFAADPIVIGGSGTNNTVDNTTTNNVENTTNNNVITPTTNGNVSSYSTPTNSTNINTLPKTGENDIYIVTVLLVVCGISAIYAYKKIRDYNM